MDFTREYTQQFSFYEVERGAWGDGRLLETVAACSFVEDAESRIRQSATLSTDGESLGETVVRCYMTATQDGASERICLGTWLVQRPRRSYAAQYASEDATCLGLLQAVDDTRPPYGYSVPAGANCAQQAEQALSHGIAPVVAAESDAVLSRPWVASPDDTWLDVAMAMADAADMEVGCDAYGRPTLATKRIAAPPAWTFADDDSSVLLPDAEEELDWYAVPNAVELVWTGPPVVVGRAVNDDASSPLSTVSRGREVLLREIDPTDLASNPTQATADLLAARRLEEESSLSRTVTVRHGVVPLRAGQSAEVAWRSAGLSIVGTVARTEASVETGMTATTTIKADNAMWRMKAE